MSTIDPIICACAIVFRDGKMLATTRRNTTDQWGLPGGKLDPGETPVEAVCRETMEETGCRIVIDYTITPFVREDKGPKDHKVYRTYCYLATTNDHPTQIDPEISADFRPVGDLLSGPFADYNQSALQHIEDQILLNDQMICWENHTGLLVPSTPCL